MLNQLLRRCPNNKTMLSEWLEFAETPAELARLHLNRNMLVWFDKIIRSGTPSLTTTTRWSVSGYTAEQSHKAVTAYFLSKQLLPFGFAEQCRLVTGAASPGSVKMTCFFMLPWLLGQNLFWSDTQYSRLPVNDDLYLQEDFSTEKQRR